METWQSAAQYAASEMQARVHPSAETGYSGWQGLVGSDISRCHSFFATEFYCPSNAMYNNGQNMNPL